MNHTLFPFITLYTQFCICNTIVKYLPKTQGHIIELVLKI